MRQSNAPKSRRIRGFILTKQAITILDAALRGWWSTSEEQQASRTGKLTRQGKAQKLEVNIHTLDKIYQQVGVDKSTLQLAFHKVGGRLEDEYCLPACADDLPASSAQAPGGVPPPPALILGRENALRDLKNRVISQRSGQNAPTMTVMRGWPGIGKTTMAAALVHDSQIMTAFPNGVLWISLGTDPNILVLLAGLIRQLNSEDIGADATVEEASRRLGMLLRSRRLLLVVDDAWQQEHALPFLVGGAGCGMLVTTRDNGLARAITSEADDVYVLPVLEDKHALQVLRVLAPAVVTRHPKSCLALCRELEGLPLALQVAGHLLNEEESLGSDVAAFLKELRQGAKILEATAPADRADLIKETTPTVAALFEKSTDRLTPKAYECFALLGPFAAKPATFDLGILKLMWQLKDPMPVVRTLVGRGLLEPAGNGRFQMHALLITHARSLLEKE